MSGVHGPRSYYCPRLLQRPPKLSLDLEVDVQRLLTLANAALVAGDHQLAHLLDQLGIGPVARRPEALVEQPGELGVDVERRLAAGALPVGLGLEQLAELGLAGLGRARSAASSVIRRGRSLSNSTANWPLPIWRRASPGPEHEGDQGDRDRRQDDDQDHLAGAEADRDGPPA